MGAAWQIAYRDSSPTGPAISSTSAAALARAARGRRHDVRVEERHRRLLPRRGRRGRDYVLPERAAGSAARCCGRPPARARLWFKDNHPARSTPPASPRTAPSIDPGTGLGRRFVALSWDELVAAALIGTDRRPVGPDVPEGRRRAWRPRSKRAASRTGCWAPRRPGRSRGGRARSPARRSPSSPPSRTRGRSPGHDAAPAPRGRTPGAAGRMAGAGRGARAAAAARARPGAARPRGRSPPSCTRRRARRRGRWDAGWPSAARTGRSCAGRARTSRPSGPTAAPTSAARCSSACAGATRAPRASCWRARSPTRPGRTAPRSSPRSRSASPTTTSRCSNRAGRPPQARPRSAAAPARRPPALALRRPHGRTHRPAAARGGRRLRGRRLVAELPGDPDAAAKRDGVPAGGRRSERLHALLRDAARRRPAPPAAAPAAGDAAGGRAAPARRRRPLRASSTPGGPRRRRPARRRVGAGAVGRAPRPGAARRAAPRRGADARRPGRPAGRRRDGAARAVGPRCRRR